MRIYDEENLPYENGDDDDMTGYTVIEDNSIFKILHEEAEPETIATPIPENEQTVLLDNPRTERIADGKELTLRFAATDACDVYADAKCVGALKPAYVRKLKNERGGQCARVYNKRSVPPMVRIVFGEGEPIPAPEAAPDAE